MSLPTPEDRPELGVEDVYDLLYPDPTGIDDEWQKLNPEEWARDRS